MNAPFATALAGWKASAKNKLAWPLVPNAADVDSAESMRIAAGVLDELGVARNVMSDVPKDPGGPLEQAVCDHLRSALPGYGTGRDWLIRRGQLITDGAGEREFAETPLAAPPAKLMLASKGGFVARFP